MTVPKLRFKEFDNKYKQTSFEKLKGFSIKSGKSNNKEESGEYPFYGSTGIIGYKSDYDYTGKAILIARVGANAGSLYQVDGKYSVSDNTLILAASDATNLDYVRELLVKFNLNRLVFGTGQPLVTGGLIKKVFISIPEVKEQTKIAYFLSAVDDKISQLTQEHELLSEYKKGIMQQIFSQKLRFKADDGSDFGDWEEGKLGDIVRVNPKAKELPESFFYIDLESVKKGQLLIEKHIKRQDAPSRAQRLLEKGDVLFQMVRPYQKNNYYFDLDGDYVASTGYAQIRANLCSKFIYYLLHEEMFLDEVMNRCTGTSYPAINSSDLSSIELFTPCVEEQAKIANFLSAIDQKLDNVAAQIDQAKEWKKGLLQQMFI